MNQFTRIGTSMVLLLVLLLGALAINNWLHRQTQNQIRQLNEAAVDLKRTQFQEAAARLGAPASSTPENLTEIGRVIGATVSLEGDAPSVSPSGLLTFSEALGAGGANR